MKLKLRWPYIAAVLGALINITVQLSKFYADGQAFQQFDVTFSEFLRQFSWLMMTVSAGFFALIGYLYQQRVDEREEAVEIEATLKAKHLPKEDVAK